MQDFTVSVKNFSEIAEPLTRLTKKGVEFKWGQEQHNSFNKLKQILTSEPVMAHFDSKLPIIVRCDASNIGLGSTLLQYASDVRGCHSL